MHLEDIANARQTGYYRKVIGPGVFGYPCRLGRGMRLAVLLSREVVLVVSHPAQLPLEELLKDCRVQRTRGSGPGGQHRNKVETAIVVEHLPTGLRGEASERRSQDQNRRQAIHRLRVKLALGERRLPADESSEAWQQRTKAGRISVNPEHEDFPGLLAEALDIVCASNFEIPTAANHLKLTASQLVKFLKIERVALELVNRERVSLGLTKLQ